VVEQLEVRNLTADSELADGIYADHSVARA
jgi:hypothetical protein